MPALIAHSLVALQGLDMLDDSELKTAIERHKSLFLLAAQGPDIYFYYGVLSHKCITSNIKKIGSIMHKHKPAASIECFRNYYLNCESTEEKEYSLVILAGFLCHYALDTNAHPFVYYLQKKLNEKPNHGQMHARIEASLDEWLINNRLKESLPEFYKKIFSLTDLEMKHYCIIFSFAGKEVSGQDVSSLDILNALTSMAKATRLFYCLKVHLRWIVSICRSLPFKWAGVTEHFIIKSPIGKFDYINQAQNEWFNIVDTSFTSNKSFSDILEKASDDALQFMKKLCDEKILDASVWETTKNISFDSGLEIKL